MQVRCGQTIHVSVDGMKPVVESDDQLFILFSPLRNNRLDINLQLYNDDVTGHVTMKGNGGRNQFKLISHLSFRLPPATDCEQDNQLKDASSLNTDEENWVTQVSKVTKTVITKTELRLTDIAEELGDDWIPIARQLGVTEFTIEQINTDYSHPAEQVVYHLSCAQVINQLHNYSQTGELVVIWPTTWFAKLLARH